MLPGVPRLQPELCTDLPLRVEALAEFDQLVAGRLGLILSSESEPSPFTCKLLRQLVCLCIEIYARHLNIVVQRGSPAESGSSRPRPIVVASSAGRRSVARHSDRYS